MIFDRNLFDSFCKELSVETKEKGIVKLGTCMLGTQKYILDEIAKGLKDDIHHFVILKGRQLGITTISLALDLYWQFVNPGFAGTLVTHDEESRNMFRSTLDMYMQGLPNRFRIPVVAHNRTQLVLKNRSRLFYQVAGTRSNGTLGRGKAITYLHSTETSSYGDEEGLASLLASLAQTNPLRLYMFESTARGFNLFHDMYVTAKKARTQQAIFCGWWRNELYSADPESNVYKTYWDKKLTGDEKIWVKEIKKLYGFEITSRQIAWWRWTMAEIIKDDALMYQEFPPTEDYAFIMTGSSFFSNARITDVFKEARLTTPDMYRYSMGVNFQDTEILRSNERMATLKIWEEPIDTAYYVIGADPAYGSSDWADRFCIQVYRCYADGLDQVAEFATSELNTYQFAWVIAHLAGAYKNSTLNLEVNGPGQAVINELRNLKRQAISLGGPMGRDLMNVLGSMQNYMWRRNDTLGGPSNSLGYVTTQATKERMLSYMKDYFERGMMTVKSTDLLDEMKAIVRDGGTLAGEGRSKDDRVIASALAAVAYAEQVQPRLLMQRITRKVSHQQEGHSESELKVGSQVQDYLKKIGLHGR